MVDRSDPRIGTKIAGYRVDRLLGEGGMGAVYEAEDLALGRRVALKLLSDDLSADESFRERFRLESRLAASIDDAHVIPIYEASQADDGTLFIAMRYVEGADLKEVIRASSLMRSSLPRPRPLSSPRLTKAAQRSCVTRAARPGTRRESSTRTARRSCTPTV